MKNPEFVSDLEIQALQPWIDRILSALGVEALYVSDESLVSDFFLPYLSEEEKEEVVQELSRMLDVPLGTYRNLCLLALARKLKASEMH